MKSPSISGDLFLVVASWFLRRSGSRVSILIAFHEKAGRSQVDSSQASLNKVIVSRRVAAVAMLPSALSRSDSFRSVHVGRSRFSRCCHLFGALWFCSSEWNLGQAINAVTGTRLWLLFFLPKNVLTLFCLFVFTRLPPRSSGCSCAAVRTLLRSPTDDAATPPAFWRSLRWLASSRFFHRAPPVSAPST